MIYDFDKLTFNILTIKKVCHPDGFFCVRGRPFSAFIFRAGGNVEFEIGDKNYPIKSGDVSFMPENLSYNANYSECEFIVVHLTECNYNKFENINIKNSSYVKEEFNNLLNDWNKNQSVNSAKSSVYKILQYIADEKKLNEYDNVFIECVNYINANFCNSDLSISEICKKLYISESSLLRKFHKYYNITTKEYLLDLRLRKAIDLLITGKYSINAISKMCGFNDEKYFSRLFKKKYNQSPSCFYKSSSN